MKSLQELYDEVKRDDALKKSFVEAMREGVAEDALLAKVLVHGIRIHVVPSAVFNWHGSRVASY